jgi:hypothetical protein
MGLWRWITGPEIKQKKENGSQKITFPDQHSNGPKPIHVLK